ncbi:MAG: DUF4446 family protein [Candidatus Moraniibacteriota bacterium]
MEQILIKNLSYILLVIAFLFFVSVFLNIFLLFKFKKFNLLAKKFFAGKNGRDLEAVIGQQVELILKNQKDIKELFDGYEKIFNIASKGIQKVGVVRYNPFRDMGGNQSFSIALLDMNNCGLIISTLATRDGARVFSKAVTNGECKDFPLIEEEKRAIQEAKNSKKRLAV